MLKKHQNVLLVYKKMLIELDDTAYDAMLHELRDVAVYLGTISKLFDEDTMLIHKKTLTRIREDLRSSTKDEE